jgi:hypothetical protein
LVTKVAKRFTGAKSLAAPAIDDLAGFYHEDAKRVESATGELALDWGAGRLSLDAPQVQGWVGALGGAGPLSTSAMGVDVAAAHPWSGVLAVALDGKPLGQSQRVAVAAVGRCENTGQAYAPNHKALRSLGGLPVLMEGLDAQVRLALGPGRWQARALDADGRPGSPVALQASAEGQSWSLKPGDQGLIYLLDKAE